LELDRAAIEHIRALKETDFELAYLAMLTRPSRPERASSRRSSAPRPPAWTSTWTGSQSDPWTNRPKPCASKAFYSGTRPAASSNTLSSRTHRTTCPRQRRRSSFTGPAKAAGSPPCCFRRTAGSTGSSKPIDEPAPAHARPDTRHRRIEAKNLLPAAPPSVETGISSEKSSRTAESEKNLLSTLAGPL